MLDRDFRSIRKNPKKLEVETEGIEMTARNIIWKRLVDECEKKVKEEINEASILKKLQIK